MRDESHVLKEGKSDKCVKGTSLKNDIFINIFSSNFNPKKSFLSYGP